MRDNPQSGSSNLTRRAFLQTTGGTAAAAVIAGYSTSGQSASPADMADGPNIEGAVPITLRINGKDANFALTLGRRSSIASVRPLLSPERRRAVTTGNAAHVRCM